MDATDTKILEIGNRCWELWSSLPEPKKAYSIWWIEVKEALENWPLSDREKRIADREKGDAGI